MFGAVWALAIHSASRNSPHGVLNSISPEWAATVASVRTAVIRQFERTRRGAFVLSQPHHDCR
jgi:hypothetical protein